MWDGRPQRWPVLTDQLIGAGALGDVQCVMALMGLRALAEDTTQFNDDIPPSRRTDLVQSLLLTNNVLTPRLVDARTQGVHGADHAIHRKRISILPRRAAALARTRSAIIIIIMLHRIDVQLSQSHRHGVQDPRLAVRVGAAAARGNMTSLRAC